MQQRASPGHILEVKLIKINKIIIIVIVIVIYYKNWDLLYSLGTFLKFALVKYGRQNITHLDSNLVLSLRKQFNYLYKIIIDFFLTRSHK